MPKIERNGGILLVAYILIQDEKGNDDDETNNTVEWKHEGDSMIEIR